MRAWRELVDGGYVHGESWGIGKQRRLIWAPAQGMVDGGFMHAENWCEKHRPIFAHIFFRVRLELNCCFLTHLFLEEVFVRGFHFFGAHFWSALFRAIFLWFEAVRTTKKFLVGFLVGFLVTFCGLSLWRAVRLLGT